MFQIFLKQFLSKLHVNPRILSAKNELNPKNSNYLCQSIFPRKTGRPYRGLKETGRTTGPARLVGYYRPDDSPLPESCGERPGDSPEKRRPATITPIMFLLFLGEKFHFFKAEHGIFHKKLTKLLLLGPLIKQQRLQLSARNKIQTDGFFAELPFSAPESKDKVHITLVKPPPPLRYVPKIGTLSTFPEDRLHQRAIVNALSILKI
jgi:hypothetical protein